MAKSDEYKQNIENLKISIDNIDSLIETLENPQMLYKEGIAPEGSKINDYLFDFTVFGHEFNWTLSTTEVESLEFKPQITAEEKEATAMDTKYTITEKAVQKTNTTRKRIIAYIDILKRWITGKDVGDIYLFGIHIHKGKDIHGHDAEKANSGNIGNIAKTLDDNDIGEI